MVDTSQTHQYCVTKQPNTTEETDQVYRTIPKYSEVAPAINSGLSITDEDLLRCLCWCCYLTLNNNTDSDSNCCSNRCCDCDCDCSGCCECCDCGGCDCGGCDCGGCDC